MTDKKKCFKCGETKNLSAFYKHKQMKDGHVNKCKDCNKKDVRENRLSKLEYYREYDRERGARQPPEYQRKYRSENPNKYKAHRLVGSAIRAGLMCSEPCEVCGDNGKNHAHHDDYLKPYKVRWLCAACHKAWHKENGEGLNPR